MQSNTLHTMDKPPHDAILPSTVAENEEVPPPLPPPTKKIKSETMKEARGAAANDRISYLPEHILHLMMSFLLPQDAARISTLSKRWNSTWATFPNFHLDQALFEKTLPASLTAAGKKEMFTLYLLKSLQNRTMATKIQKFELEVLNLGEKPDSNIDAAIKMAVDNNVGEIILDFGVPYTRHFYECPKCLYTAKSLISLDLNGFKVKLGELLSGSPSMERLILKNCKGPDLELVHASSPKLKTLDISRERDLNNLKLEAPDLQSFQYVGDEHDVFGRHYRPCNVDFAECKFLKTVTLKNARVTNQWLKRHVSALVCVESLTLESCIDLTKVEIFHEKIKTFHLRKCISGVQVEIDAPSLRSILYEGEIPRFGLLNSSSSLDAALILLRNDVAEWFVKLRGLLGLFGHCKVLKLDCQSFNDLIFAEEVKDKYYPPLYDLKHLEVECHSVEVDYTKLVESLLWVSPHVETLSFVASETEENHGRCTHQRQLRRTVKPQDPPKPIIMKKLICQFEYGKAPGDLEEEEEEDWLCFYWPNPKECWQHRLKKVIILNFEGSTHRDKETLFKYFSQNAKILQSIQDNS